MNTQTNCILVTLFMLGAGLSPRNGYAQSGDSIAASVRPPVSASWTADRRTFAVGDIITVLVDEQTIASADKSNIDSHGRGTDATLGAGGVVRGGSTGGADVVFRTGISHDANERGQARRSDRLAGEVSVRVVAIESGGLLKVEGTRTLMIDQQEQKLTLSGLIRPQDVSRKNVLDSWRMSDAQIAYASNGDMGKPKRSFMGRMLGIIWP